MYVGRVSVLMYCNHDVCMVVCWGLVSLCSFLCYVVEGRSRVARRVSSAVRRAVLGPVLSVFGSLDGSASVGGCVECSVRLRGVEL